MLRHKGWSISLIIAWLLLQLPLAAWADALPGDVINDKNWETAKGLLPDSILNWIKNGDYTIRVAKLNYEPTEYRNPVVKASLEANRGKYDLDENDVIIDVKTGKPPEFIEGLPFPQEDFDVNDPKAGAKIVYNKYATYYSQGKQINPWDGVWVGRRSGYERAIISDYHCYPFVYDPKARAEPNKRGFESFRVIRILAPFDIKGTSVLLWRYRGAKNDSSFAYVPAIRRVRRMSPANRSDAYVGTDLCVDDAWIYDGKVTAFDWRLVRKEDALMPFLDPEVQPLENGGKEAEWKTTLTMKQVAWAYDDKKWQGAPWFPTNTVWVKRPVYVLEAKAKDPYYNYGTTYIWADREVDMMGIKTIYDRANKYWKTIWYPISAFATSDRKMTLWAGTAANMVDDRSDHATNLRLMEPKPSKVYLYGAKLHEDDYTLAGFARICK